MDKISDLQIGKAGEYLVCADLILQGHIAFPSEQGLPYDVVFDYKGRLFKVQVKTTRTTKDIPQRKIAVRGYIFNIKRCGKNNHSRTTNDSCDLFALVALDSKIIGYLPNTDVKETMNFRCEKFRGQYRDENIKTVQSGRYLEDLTLEHCLEALEIW
jgi:hypothetical protein